MKTIYKINKVVVIVNLILFLTIYFGMLFLPVTGIVQLVMFGIYCYKWQSVVEPPVSYTHLTLPTICSV